MVITQTLNRNISMGGQEVTGLVMDLQKPDSKYNRKSNLVPAREFQSPDHGHWKTQDDHIGAEVDDASGKICCFPVSAHTALDSWIPVERKRSAKEELLKVSSLSQGRRTCMNLSFEEGRNVSVGNRFFSSTQMSTIFRLKISGPSIRPSRICGIMLGEQMI